jgi:hypothetical protein
MGINVGVVSVDKALQTGSEEIGRVLPDDLDPRIEQEIEGAGHIYAESTKTGFCLIYVRWELLSGQGWRRWADRTHQCCKTRCRHNTWLGWTASYSLHIDTSLELLTARKIRDLSLLVTLSRYVWPAH